MDRSIGPGLGRDPQPACRGVNQCGPGGGSARAGCVAEVLREGNGSEERRPRRRQIRLQGSRRGPLESYRAEQLYEHAIAANEGHVVEGGALCAETGIHTGRSPKDKLTVCRCARPRTRSGGTGNRKLTPGAVRAAATTISSRMRAARSCSRRTSMAAPIRNTASRRASSPSLPGTRCSSASC